MNQDALTLIKKAEESLKVAHDLHNGCHYDFAVGRAYYAMFYMAESALLIKGKAFSSHRAVHNGFYHEFIESGILDKIQHQSTSEVLNCGRRGITEVLLQLQKNSARIFYIAPANFSNQSENW